MFFVSLLFTLLTSYFIAGIFTPKNKKLNYTSFLIILITIFAQIVLATEILSLFKAISATNLLIFNLIFFIIFGIFWYKKGKPIYKPDIKTTFLKIYKALKKDKILMIMAYGFLFFIFITICLNLFMPVLSYDALTYHLNRAAFWMSQGSLNHFDIADDRNLVMPINSEILYLWVLLFVKKDIGLYFFSFFGYIAAIFSIYNILGVFGFCERKKIWTIFILSAFASVIGQVSSLETDVLISGLVLSCIALFLGYLKEEKSERKKSILFFSTLSYALAMGTKSPAIIAFPGVFLLLSYFSIKKDKKDFYKPLSLFLGMVFINFLIFSSYNYILNFLQFGNFLGSESARAIHGFRGGIKALIANYIRYIFMLFDFSGFRYSEYVGEYITQAKLTILAFLHIPSELGVEMTDNNLINNRLLDVKMGTGILGFLLFLPGVVVSVLMPIINKLQNKVCEKANMLAAFGWMFFINIFCLSFSIAFMVFSIRFVTFLVVISAPVLAITYMKKTNLIKLLILFFVMSYFLVISTNLSARPCSQIIKVILTQRTLDDAREKIRCALLVGYEGKMSFCYLRDMMRTTPKGTSFGILPNMNSRLYVVKMLETEGYKVDVLLPEKLLDYNLSKYDYLITTDNIHTSSVLLQDTKDTKVKYKVNEKGDAVFKENYPYTCAYISHDDYKIYDPNKNNQIIVASSCFVQKDFFKNNGFDFIQSLDFKSNIKENANFMTIYKKHLK